MISCWPSSELNAKRCPWSEFLLVAFAADRLGNIDAEEKPFIETVCTARDATDVVFVAIDAGWRDDDAGKIACARCASAIDGKPAAKTTKANPRLLERNIGPTALLLVTRS
jgi:hypothetical protein